MEKAWKQQRQFVADASHELKTPLTVIMTNAELLQSSGCGEEEQRRFFRSHPCHVTADEGLIEQMLDLARADSGQAEAAFEQVDLSRTAEDSLLLFDPFILNRINALCRNRRRYSDLGLKGQAEPASGYSFRQCLQIFEPGRNHLGKA